MDDVAKRSLTIAALEKNAQMLTIDKESGWPNWDSIPFGECKPIASVFGDDITDTMVKTAIVNAAKHTLFVTGHKKLTKKDAEAIAQNVHDYFDAFPRKYLFALKLPTSSASLATTDLSGAVQVTTLTAETAGAFTSPHTLISPANAFQDGDSAGLIAGDNLLLISTTGYVSNLVDFSLKDWDPTYLFKLLIAGYITLGALEKKSGAGAAGKLMSSFPFYCYDVTKPGIQQFIKQFDESAEQYKLVETYTFTGDAQTIGFAHEAMRNLLLSQKSNHIKRIQKEIKNSLFWLNESLTARLPHLKVVFLVTAYDSFFTKNDKQEHISRVISLLTASDVNDEKRIRDDIRRLYDLRNSVVHGEKVIGVFNQSSQEQDEEAVIVARCTAHLQIFLLNRLKNLHLSQTEKSAP
jgi:hypothetical protein